MGVIQEINNINTFRFNNFDCVGKIKYGYIYNFSLYVSKYSSNRILFSL